MYKVLSIFIVIIANFTLAAVADENIQYATERDEGDCFYMLEFAEGVRKGKIGVTNLGELQVIPETKLGLLEPSIPAEARVKFVVCERRVPIPSKFDYRVMLSGYDLMTVSIDHERFFITYLSKGNLEYLFEMKTGSLTNEEQKVIDQVLEQFAIDEKDFLSLHDVQ